MEVDMDKLELRVLTAGPAALVARMCDILRIPQLIDSVVEWDPKNCRLSPGLRAKAMIINILTDRRALYDVEKFYQTQDLEVLFGPRSGLRLVWGAYWSALTVWAPEKEVLAVFVSWRKYGENDFSTGRQ